MDDSAIQKFQITDLFNIENIQKLQDDFSTATGVASIITHPDGSPITRPSNFTRLCECFIRGTKEGEANCLRSDAELGKLDLGGPHMQQCLSGGLWDAGAGIQVNGRHIANWLIGQVRNESQTEESIIEYAKKIGSDPEGMLQAFREVPKMSKEKFFSIAQLLYTLASQLSQLALQNLNLRKNLNAQKEIEKDLSISRKRYRELTENTSDWLWEMDSEAIFSYSSPRVKEILGYEPEELLGTSGFDLMPPNEVEKIQLQFFDYVDKNLPFSNLLNINLHKDGHRVFLESSGVPFFNDSGTLLGYRGMDRDITQRYLAEAEAGTFKAIAEKASYGVMISNLKLEVHYVNQAFADLLNYSVEELMGMHLQNLVPEKDHRSVNLQFIRLLKEKALNGLEMVLVKKGGETFPAMISAGLLEGTGEAAPQITGTVTDISSNKEMEKILLHSQKMDSIGQLAAGVAHDFNNMLSGIMGSAEILLNQFKENKQAAPYLEMILEAADRSAELASNLLIFSQKKSVEMSLVNICEVIKQSKSILEKTTQRKLHISYEDNSGDGKISGNINLLQSVFINLGINASHAMPQGGRLKFETSDVVLNLEDCCKSSFDLTPGRYIRISVSDTGTGIPEEIIQKIFDPFFTTRSQGMGTGLGLSAVFGSVVLHRGSITVSSKPGKGTKFILHFPLKE